MSWKDEENVPSHREISDGLSLFVYCKNKNCIIFKQMFILNKAYGVFKIDKEIKDKTLVCPKC